MKKNKTLLIVIVDDAVLDVVVAADSCWTYIENVLCIICLLAESRPFRWQVNKLCASVWWYDRSSVYETSRILRVAPGIAAQVSNRRKRKVPENWGPILKSSMSARGLTRRLNYTSHSYFVWKLVDTRFLFQIKAHYLKC